MPLDELVTALRDDRVSGSTEVARAAADVLRKAAEELPADSADALASALRAVTRGVIDAQPAMAPLLALAREVHGALESAETLEGARRAVARAADDFAKGLDAKAASVAGWALEVLPEGGLVATISSSGTVRAALIEAGRRKSTRALCFESRPMNEGRSLSSSLAAGGVDVTYAVDAAIEALVPACDAAVIGADSIGDAGVVNKVGSLGLARASAAGGIPLYVLADSTKVLPVGWPQHVDDERPPSEVWEAPPGVSVWNRYFERVPLDYVSVAVTERGPMSVAALEELRHAIAFPPFARASGSHETPP